VDSCDLFGHNDLLDGCGLSGDAVLFEGCGLPGGCLRPLVAALWVGYWLETVMSLRHDSRWSTAASAFGSLPTMRQVLAHADMAVIAFSACHIIPRGPVTVPGTFYLHDCT